MVGVKILDSKKAKSVPKERQPNDEKREENKIIFNKKIKYE